LAAERGRAPNTLAAYRRDLAQWTEWLDERGRTVHDASTDDVTDLLGDRLTRGRAPATVQRLLVAVRSLHQFMVREGLRDDDPTVDVERPKLPRALPKALGESDVGRLLDAVAGEDPVARRDRAMLEVLYGTGARISEVVGLDLVDADLEEANLRVLGKGGKERMVPIGRIAAAALAAWLAPEGRGEMTPPRWARRGDSEAVFLNQRGGRLTRQGAWGVVRRRARAVGLSEAMSPHVLRHSCATHMLDHGADVRTVQELLGHASVSTTQVYTKVSSTRLRAVYDAAHPRARSGSESR
jgi:integrase/recombinase XerD